MTFPYNVVRVTMTGTCFNGAEEWSTGFYLGKEDASVPDVTQANCDSIATKWQTFFTHADAGISTSYKTERVTMLPYFASGAPYSDNVKYHDFSPNINGASFNPLFPGQTSMVATLRSTRAHGKASHGRMFLPGVSWPVQSDGHTSGTDRDKVGLRFKEFITAVRGDAAQPGYPILEAKGGTILPLAESAYIFSVKVGNVYDTQRRRRNGLSESYYAANI